MTDEAGGTTPPPASPEEVAHLFDVLEHVILGETRSLSRVDVARETGAPLERLQDLWRSLGFPTVSSDDDVQFINADVEALQLLNDLLEVGMVDPEAEYAVARSMGRSFARLAEWQIAEIVSGLARSGTRVDVAAVEGLVSQLLPVVERLQSYAWRRHLANAAGRLLLQPGPGEHGVPMAVGFADIVGFTRSSRRMSGDELGALVETFESTVSSVINGQGGRVIKTIGDEVLYAADDPIVAARISLELAEGHETDEDFPEVRVGVAYGDVLSRMGDVFGEVVNIASRLTSLARPGRVLMNRELADLLAEHDEEFRVRRARSSAVKGYSRLETWSLRRPKPPPEEREPRRQARIEATLDALQLSADPAIEALETLVERLPGGRRRGVEPDEDPAE